MPFLSLLDLLVLPVVFAVFAGLLYLAYRGALYLIRKGASAAREGWEEGDRRDE